MRMERKKYSDITFSAILWVNVVLYGSLGQVKIHTSIYRKWSKAHVAKIELNSSNENHILISSDRREIQRNRSGRRDNERRRKKKKRKVAPYTY